MTVAGRRSIPTSTWLSWWMATTVKRELWLLEAEATSSRQVHAKDPVAMLRFFSDLVCVSWQAPLSSVFVSVSVFCFSVQLAHAAS